MQANIKSLYQLTCILNTSFRVFTGCWPSGQAAGGHAHLPLRPPLGPAAPPPRRRAAARGALGAAASGGGDERGGAAAQLEVLVMVVDVVVVVVVSSVLKGG